MIYDVIIAGGGMAGLTAAAYLTREGRKVLLIEQQEEIGGLVSSFDYKGFRFDGGIRSIENSGIVFPMLEELGIDIDFIRSIVSIGIADKVVTIDSNDKLEDYRNLLASNFPENNEDIDKIIIDIRKIMDYMDILYGIDNPLFKDIKKDREYLFHTLLPWMGKFVLTIGKINRLNDPAEEYLKHFTDNDTLISIIAQHFFRSTPAFFAMSYFSLYLDYNYPVGGTGQLPLKMKEYIENHNGQIMTGKRITALNPELRVLKTADGTEFTYRELIWTGDNKSLYNIIDTTLIESPELIGKIEKKRYFLKDKKGNDSILTLYLTLDLDKSFFSKICTEHFFYTPLLKGLHNADISELHIVTGDTENKQFTENRKEIEEWLKRYFDYTTYEISIPVMRDENLAPEGQTGLIISTLMDYSLVKHINEMGWYAEFKKIAEDSIVDILARSAFKGFENHIMDGFVSTPLTIERLTSNTDGAITGWSFTNNSIPAISNLTKVAKSVLTEIPDVYIAGQWSYSPSGLPISILTGKLAANEVLKKK